MRILKYDIEEVTGIPWKKKKSYRYLYRLACREDVIKKAFKRMRKGKTKRKDFQMAEENLDAWVKKIQEIILNTKPDGWQTDPQKRFKPVKHNPVIIKEFGKTRVVYVPTMVELWIQHVIVMILEPIIAGSSYPMSFSSFPGRGSLKGQRAIRRWIESGKGIRNFAQADIRHFYSHIQYKIVRKKLERRVKDNFFLHLIDVCMTYFPKEMPLGFYLSQWLANFMLQELDYDRIPNAKENIGAEYYEQAAAYDPGNKYCVPYCWGTVGIIYNKTLVDTPPTKWADLWDEKYSDEILMMDSIKDCFMVALKKNGFSSNSLDESELQIATEDLIAQKPLVQAYVVDQVRDKMIGGEAAMGVMFSGDALYVMSENEDLDFVIPEEGTNVWIDGWVIPKNAPNKENAEKFIDFMCHPDVALKNFEYITYGTPNTAARELIEDEDLKNSPIAFPDLTQYNNLETFLYLGEDGEELYNKYWKEVMSN